MSEITTEQWEEAKAYFDRTMQVYQEMLGQPHTMTGPALMVTFEPLLRRYNDGERSQELYEAMLEVE